MSLLMLGNSKAAFRKQRHCSTNSEEDNGMNSLCILLLAVCLLVVVCAGVPATPSSTFWTPCTSDIQPAGVTHLGIDNYFQIGDSSGIAQFPTDLGVELGANLSPKLALEYGVDLLGATNDPLFFNAKVGYRENVLSRNSPALQIGFFNFGTQSGVTDQNIAYLVAGKTLGNGRTRLHAAYYVGNASVLRSSDGASENSGFMLAFDHQLTPGKWVLACDYASGSNAIGGGGVGVYYYFTKDTSLLMGPVWFNDQGINGSMKWTAQLDINF